MTSDQAKQLLTDPKFLAFAAGMKMEWKYDTGWREFSAMLSEDFIERTDRIRIAPEPARVPLTADDWDGPTWWIRRDPQSIYADVQVSEFRENAVMTHNFIRTHKELMDLGYERSRDRVTWTPCWKEEV